MTTKQQLIEKRRVVLEKYQDLKKAAFYDKKLRRLTKSIFTI
jgi:hypothetical protein